MNITVIGSGSWGTALAQVLADNNHNVTIWGRDDSEVEDINHGYNKKYFKDLKLNDTLKATTDLSSLADTTDVLLLATPSSAIIEICNLINNTFHNRMIIINVAKGFHLETSHRLSTVLKDTLNQELVSSVVSLIGPSHAEEVILRLETLITAVSNDIDAAISVQKLFSNDYFRVYTSTDEIGAEIGAGVKNVIALASGMVSGLGLGDNSRAALLTRGLAEMQRLGVAMGGNPQTFLGLTGVGDLIVTAMSEHSRNYQAGKKIGLDNTAKYFWEENKSTVEGVYAAKIVHNLAQEYQVSMPISEHVFKVLYEDLKPQDAIGALMSRDLKSEQY